MILKEKQMEKFKRGDVVYFMYKNRINKGFVECYIPSRKMYKIRNHLINVSEYKIWGSLLKLIISLIGCMTDKTRKYD